MMSFMTPFRLVSVEVKEVGTFDASFQHLSSNTRDYELGCMERVMMLYDLISDLAIPYG